MRIVEVIRGANADVLNVLRLSFPLIDVPVKSLKLGEKVRLGEIAVDNAYAVIWVQHGNQFVSGLFYGLHVPRCDVAGPADKGKFLHNQISY
jgi:hypothetical protein